MKNSLIGLVLLILVSCSDSSNQIIGKWKVEKIDYSEFFENAPSGLKEILESKMQEEFERLKGKTFFTFSEGEIVKLEAPNFEGKQTITEGKYSFNDTKDSLFFDLAENESYKIIKMDDKTLILSTDEQPNRVLTLSKIEE